MRHSALVKHSLVVAMMALPAVTLAHSADSVIARAGLVMVEPNEDSSDVSVSTAGIGSIGGAKVGVDNNTQLGISFTYKLSDQFGIGLLGATPFEHDISGAGSTLAGVGKLGSTRHLPPTVTFQFFPLEASYPVQPYVGVGLNYTTFFKEKTTDNLTDVFQFVADAYNTGLTVTDVDMKLDDSFGLAAEVGVDIMLTDRLILNAAVWMVDIDTEAKLTGRTAQGVNIDAKVDVNIDPTVYMVSLGYKF